MAFTFAAVNGLPPMAPRHRRMLLAANLLRRSIVPLARIAEDVGYRTGTAFSRAFLRETARGPRAEGVRPG